MADYNRIIERSKTEITRASIEAVVGTGIGILGAAAYGVCAGVGVVGDSGLELPVAQYLAYGAIAGLGYSTVLGGQLLFMHGIFRISSATKSLYDHVSLFDGSFKKEDSFANAGDRDVPDT